MQTNCEYALYIMKIINHIIRYFIIPRNKAKTSKSDVLLAFFDKSDSSFISKLNIKLNNMIKKY